MRWILASCEVAVGAVGGTEEEETVGSSEVVADLVAPNVASTVENVGIISASALIGVVLLWR